MITCIQAISTAFKALLAHQVSKFKALAAVLLLTSASCANANLISNMYVFGDSLSDSGAINFLAPQFCPPDVYFECRFSNGPVWSELVADELGVSAETAWAFTGGTNWAVGGDRTDQLRDRQVGGYLTSTAGVADPDGLYVLWAGANDFFQSGTGNFLPENSANNILQSVGLLADAGAQNFLILNTPVVGPWATVFNNAVSDGLALLNNLNIIEFDSQSLFIDIGLNPGDYGFVDSTTPCFDGVNVCSDPDSFSLWDTVHPTAAGHRVIASAVLDVLQVPAPSTISLFGFALFVFAFRRRALLV